MMEANIGSPILSPLTQQHLFACTLEMSAKAPFSFLCTFPGPRKLLKFGVWEINQNRPQMHKFLGLKYTIRT